MGFLTIIEKTINFLTIGTTIAFLLALLLTLIVKSLAFQWYEETFLPKLYIYEEAHPKITISVVIWIFFFFTLGIITKFNIVLVS